LILVDASGLLAALDGRQRGHAECRRALEEASLPFVISPFVLAELDYLLGERAGEQHRRAFLEEVADGAFALATFATADVAAAGAVIAHFADLRVSLADASIVVLSERHGVRDVLTLDERHFRVLRGAHGLPFRILPADA